jgi:predicted nucleic acid-binding Zn ribbon protein
LRFKKSRRCQLCGESDPRCLDLVATPLGDPYGAALCNEATQTVQEIAEKSEVICANCTRKRRRVRRAVKAKRRGSTGEQYATAVDPTRTSEKNSQES